MSEQIKVGDLVWVAKPRLYRCKCVDGQYGKSVGHIFVVAKIAATESSCHDCGAVFPKRNCAYWPDGNVTEVIRLRRIPPLSELESTEHKQEQPA